MSKTKEKETKAAKAAIRPRLFFAPDEEIEITVTGYYANATGELAFVVPDGEEREAEAFTPIKHTFTFSRVPYNRLNIYRSQALHYKDGGEGAGIDILRLRDFLWTFHLKKWDLTDAEGNPVELKHDPDGTLSAESRALLDRLPASLLDTVIALFERKMNIA